jgi:hypothetical protein
MTNIYDKKTDEALDAILKQASQPTLPQGFEERMLKRLEQPPVRPEVSNVIAFPMRTKPPRANPWLIGVPLAASLLIGISLGSLGFGTSLIGTEDQDIASVATGFEEAELAAEEEQS